MSSLLKIALILLFSQISLIFAQNNKTEETTEAKEPSIDWGKCKELEPKADDKQKKALIIETCLKKHPVPQNLTEERILEHQKQIAECALKSEKWFTKSGSYKFSKAETEIKNKKLNKTIESELLKHHKKCESEAKEEYKTKDKIIEQVQLYQACMDYHITETCAIRVVQ